MNRRQAAVDLARRGFRVFPLRANGSEQEMKQPAVKDWQQKATADPSLATQLFSGPLEQANAAIATGAGILVLDFDAAKGGLASLDLLDMAGLPDSWRVKTRGGGRHVYLRVDPNTRIANGVESIPGYPGVDVRSDGGYVVAPGAAIGGKDYVDLGGAIEPAPAWLIDLLHTRPHKVAESKTPVVALDHPAMVDKATRYLQHDAPEAIEGAGGDDATYRVATRLRDFGLSKETALDLLAEHWNDTKASPPWTIEDLEKKVENAFSYATGAWGGASGLADFEPVEIADRPVPDDIPFGIAAISPFDPASLPRRRWVAGHVLARRYVTGFVAPSGAGKTTYEMMLAVAIVSGRGDIVGLSIHERCPVLLWNQEDEFEEMLRRLAAVMRAFDITFNDLIIDGRFALYMGSGADKPMMLAIRNERDQIVMSPKASGLAAFVKDRGIGVVMVDPLKELHQAHENDNDEMSLVGRVLRQIAVRGDCAVLAVHHTRKPQNGSATGYAGDMDSGRGASSLVGVTRIGLTLYEMDETTAKAFGVPDEDRHRYVRVDDGKNNLALKSSEPQFFRREGINIRSFEDIEEVGVLRPVLLGKAKSNAERHADDLAESVVAAMGDEPARAVTAIADDLITSDPLYADAKKPSLVRAIKRLFESGNVGDLKLQEHWRFGGVGRPAAAVAREFLTNGQADSADAENN